MSINFKFQNSNYSTPCHFLPDVSAVDFTMDDFVNETEDVYVPATELSINYNNYILPKPASAAVVFPKLRTGIPQRRAATGRAHLAAASKRNFLVGQTMPGCCAADFSLACFNNFVRAYCIPETEAVLKHCKDRPIFIKFYSDTYYHYM